MGGKSCCLLAISTRDTRTKKRSEEVGGSRTEKGTEGMNLGWNRYSRGGGGEAQKNEKFQPAQ